MGLRGCSAVDFVVCISVNAVLADKIFCTQVLKKKKT